MNKDRRAFPSDNNRSDEHDGLTKLEYFAAHAPKIIPKWFKPQMEARPKKPAYVVSLFVNEDKKYVESYNDEDGTFDETAEVPEEFKEKIFAQIKLLDIWLDKDNAWESLYNIERMTQWPLFYADNLLKKLD